MKTLNIRGWGWGWGERAASPWPTWVSGLVGHFVQTWPDGELLSHSAVLTVATGVDVEIIITCFGTV